MERNDSFTVTQEKKVYWGIVAIAIAVPVVVAILLFMPSKLDIQSSWVHFLPHLNAWINTAASLALILGLVFIKKGNIEFHRASITTAMGLGAIFLVSYVVYHASAESTPFGGQGWVRPVYYSILITHIVLAAVALFPILLAFYYGHTDQKAKHRKIVKFAYPIWLYVSVSGVVVYLMISPYYNF